MRRAAAALAVFLLSLSFFTFRYSYILPATLVIEGTAPAAASFELRWDSGSGFTEYERALFAVNDGESTFRRTFDLPQMPLRRIKLTQAAGSAPLSVQAVSVASENGTFVVPGSAVDLSKEIVLENFDPQITAFKPLLFLIQALLALLLAWLVWLSLGTSVHAIFLAEGRWFFWTVFCAATVCFSLWLFAFWPGWMTNDSWTTLSQVAALNFTDWHPYVYSMTVLALLQVVQSVAFVTFCQITATAALGAAVFYYAWKQGTNLPLLLLFILLFVTSIPIGLMNIMLWKDVPFSIAVVLFSLLLYRAAVMRETTGGYPSFRAWHYPLLGLLLIALCQFRHNGYIFYLLVPILLWGKLRRRDYWTTVSFLAACFLLFQVAIPKALGFVKTTGSPYHQLRTVLTIMTHYNYYSEDRKNDIRIVEQATGMKWKRIRQLFPRNWFNLWDESRIVKRQFLPDGGNTDEYNSAFVLRLMSANLSIVLTERLYGFLHSIGLDYTGSDYKNNFFENPTQIPGNNLWPPGKLTYNITVPARSLSPALRDTLMAVFDFSRRYDGIFSTQVAIWNLAIFFLLFFAVIFWHSLRSAIALYTLPPLAAAFSVFIVGAGESWRYFYYIYLSGVLLLPLYLAYRREIRRTISPDGDNH